MVTSSVPCSHLGLISWGLCPPQQCSYPSYRDRRAALCWNDDDEPIILLLWTTSALTTTSEVSPVWGILPCAHFLPNMEIPKEGKQPFTFIFQKKKRFHNTVCGKKAIGTWLHLGWDNPGNFQMLPSNKNIALIQ